MRGGRRLVLGLALAALASVARADEACRVIWGPERVPLDDAGTQWEVRVRLCQRAWSASVLRIETRTWQRHRTAEGRWRYQRADGTEPMDALPPEAWWLLDREVPLAVVPAQPRSALATPVGA